MNASRLLRTGVLVVAAQAGIAVLGVLGLRLYTNLVSPAVFGAANLILSGCGLGLQLFVAGIVAAQLRFYSDAEARGAGDEFTRETMAWALRAAAALVGLALIAFLAFWFAGALASPGTAVIAGGVAWLFAMTVRNVLMSRIQAQRRQASYAKYQVIEAILLFGATLGALHLAPSVGSFLIGQVLAVVGLLSVVLIAEPRSRAIFSGRLAADNGFGVKAWSYGAPFAPMAFLGWLANLGDRYTLAVLLGPDAAGRYVAPFSIASRGMLLANSALCDLFRPILFDAENRRDDRNVRHTFGAWLLTSLVLSTVGLAVVYFAGTLLAGLLLAPGYRSGAVAIMLWVALGYTVAGITQIVENRLLSLGHSGRLLLPMILGAVANVTFSFVLIRSNGIVGAAQATCASFIFQNLATVGFLMHALSERSAIRDQETKVEPA